jgi:potassium efflux system protein
MKQYYGPIYAVLVLICGVYEAPLYAEKQPEVFHTAHLSAIDKQLKIVERDTQEIAPQVSRAHAKLDVISADLATIKKEIERSRGALERYLKKKYAIINQKYQEAQEIEQEYAALQDVLKQRRAILEEDKADPEFISVRLPIRASYTFADLEEVGRRINETKNKITEFERLRISATDDLTKRKKALSAVEDEIRERQRQYDSFASGEPVKGDFGIEGYTTREQGEILDLLTEQYALKRELALVRVSQGDQRMALIESQLSTARAQLAVLKEDFARIKRSLVVDSQYVARAEREREDKRQAFVEKIDRFQEKMRLLAPLREDLARRLTEYQNRFTLSASDLAQIREWNREPKAIAEWVAQASAGNVQAQEAFIDAEREYLESQIDLEKARFRLEEIKVDTIRSWNKITQRGALLDTEQEIAAEIKHYDVPKAEGQVEAAALTDKRAAAINLLHSLNVALDRIKNLTKLLRDKKNTVFKDDSVAYSQVQKLLYDSEEQIRRRIDLTAKLIELYSTTLATVSDATKKIEEVVGELASRGFWRRSNQSIEWGEARNFIPDIQRFIGDVRVVLASYTKTATIQSIGAWLWSVITSPRTLAILIIRLLSALILFFIVRSYLPDLARQLSRVSQEYGFFAYTAHAASLVLIFVSNHLIPLFIWFALFLAFRFVLIPDQYLAMLFYLASIPYLLYMAYEAITYVAAVEQRATYRVLSDSFRKRLFFVGAPLVYATIIIFFLREAFMLGSNTASQVPVILMAINFILLQIALLSLIRREWVLAFIPETTPLWEWVKDHVRHYYFVLLSFVGAIIVMSNPYVGYGRQVFYVLSRLAATIIVIPILSWIHDRLKRISSDLFFYYAEGETVKERFHSGKTWYGIYIIVTFVLFALCALIAIAHLWGYPITLYDVSRWAEYSIYTPGIDEATGKAIHVTAISLTKIFFFVLGGIATTYIVNQFLLRRIFDPLMIGVGVQNTVMTLSRYIIIIIAIILGLQNAGLDALTVKLAVLVGLTTYYMKEFVADVFCYFIILIQRPIKIGDLISIDGELIGIVRHITPRSTFVRRRNSVTVIVPNSHIITKTVANWNYTRTFFAFEDFFVTVPYNVDPAHVKALIHTVLDTNRNILKTPPPIVWLHDFVDNGYQFLVRGYLTADRVQDQWEIASSVRLEIVSLLRAQGITIASPTRILTVVQQSDSLSPHNRSEK